MQTIAMMCAVLIGLVPATAQAQEADELAHLEVVAVHHGLEVREAGLEVTDGAETFAALPGPLHVRDRLPGSAWSARAVVDCLVGDAQVVVTEGLNEIRVTVAPVHDATLDFEVVDPTGATLPDATVRWLSASHDCSPISQQDASLTATVGAGVHDLVIQAPNRGSRHVRVQLARGEARQIRVVLEAPTVRM